jgi:hypothetical protein
LADEELLRFGDGGHAVTSKLCSVCGKNTTEYDAALIYLPDVPRICLRCEHAGKVWAAKLAFRERVILEAAVVARKQVADMEDQDKELREIMAVVEGVR